MSRVVFSKKAIAYLIAHHNDPYEDLAAAVGWPAESVAGKLRALGYKRGLTAPIWWTQAREDRLRAAFHAGDTDEQIAQMLDISAGAVENRRQRLGLRRKRAYPRVEKETRAKVGALRRKGMTIPAIQRATGLSQWSVENELQRLRGGDAPAPRPATPDDSAFVAKLLSDGGMPRIRDVNGILRPGWVDANGRQWLSPAQWAA